MNIHAKVIEILENGGGGGCAGGSGSGDVSGFVGTGASVGGSVPGIFNYNGFKKKRKKHKKKHKKHESLVTEVSATGGNDGALTGGDVYSIGVDIGSKPTPRATGDLVLSPISTEPNNSTGAYGVPVNALHKHKHKHRKNATITKKDGKKLRVLDYDGYIKSKINKVTYLKK
jgi:hypothetical protein